MNVATLAAHAQGSGLPINIIQFKQCDCTGSQSQSSKQQQNRVISTANSVTAVATRQDPPQVIPGYRSRDRRHRPIGYSRNSRRKIDDDFTAVACRNDRNTEHASCAALRDPRAT